jgi:radical SAM superfamily enzyme YgiQ (UPF0313 family)
MRIALLYPPPWKIPAPGEPPDPNGDGPPATYRDGNLDGDFFQIPYGLLTLAAQALRAGHQVKVYNLSGFYWRNVERVVRSLDADVFGMSCWTANRRGVGMVATLIKQLHPNAHVIVGGPHATSLPREMLQHHSAIDTIAVGESETTLLELLERLDAGASPRGIAGTAWREEDRVVLGPERASIEDLDTLACPHELFATHIVMTSRGCPWRCTFCGAEAAWGRGYRGHSVPRVLDMLERALHKLPVRQILIKDDTFTTNKKRVLEICNGIVERRLNFAWSCDTRVDVLSDELVHAMRLAGCERMSLGVESGSARVLNLMDKKLSPEQVLRSRELARKWGISVRFYMMVGSRGETKNTLNETMRFLERAKPNQYIFSALSVTPGTRDFDLAVKQGWLNAEDYFREDFQELRTTFDASEEDTDYLREWFDKNKGIHEPWFPSVADCKEVAQRLPDHAPAELDVAAASLREGDLEAAEMHAMRALALEHPTPGVALNLLACLARRRGNAPMMRERLEKAVAWDPQHLVVQKNALAVREWLARGGKVEDLPNLASDTGFGVLERPEQPTLPAKMPDDFAVWPEAEPAS